MNALQENSQNPKWLDLVRRSCDFIDSYDEGAPTLSELGERMGSSPHHLQRIFKKVIGVSPRQYAEARRFDRFKRQVKDGESIASALYGAGFGSTSRLYERSGERLGMTPARYKKGGAGVQISYSIAKCRLGRILIAATLDGLCFLAFGDSDRDLEAELRAEFSAAELSRETEELSGVMSAALEILDGGDAAALPLDVRATAFQCRVWECLMRIPAGETRTYKQIAAEIGAPGAARAVGHACATNPVSLVIPCHRAVGSDGSLHGYRWGLERKQSLLAVEAGSNASP